MSGYRRRTVLNNASTQTSMLFTGLLLSAAIHVAALAVWRTDVSPVLFYSAPPMQLELIVDANVDVSQAALMQQPIEPVEPRVVAVEAQPQIQIRNKDEVPATDDMHAAQPAQQAVATRTVEPAAVAAVVAQPQNTLTVASQDHRAEQHRRLLELIYVEISKHKFYPYMAKRRGHQGMVKLNFVMHADGQVSDIAVTETSQYALLDDAARSAIRAISPFRVAGQYLQGEHRYDVNIDFRLN